MKIAVLASLVASAAAFAPSQQGRAATSLNAADLSNMRGVGPETAGKVVSTLVMDYGVFCGCRSKMMIILPRILSDRCLDEIAVEFTHLHLSHSSSLCLPTNITVRSSGFGTNGSSGLSAQGGTV
jgi:hypothetical protein